ncbi:unnamed protein product, partial [Didymodactylos carnosus]
MHYTLDDTRQQLNELPVLVEKLVHAHVNSDGAIIFNGLKKYLNQIRQCGHMTIIGKKACYRSALGIALFLKELLSIPVTVLLPLDFRYGAIKRSGLFFFVSDSHLTTDAESVLRYCKERGAVILAMTNNESSRIACGTHCDFVVNIGAEKSCSNVKAYILYSIELILFDLNLCEDMIRQDRRCELLLDELRQCPDLIRRLFKCDGDVFDYAQQLNHLKESFLLIMGNRLNLGICLESAD